jgi:hypothetical protein
MYSDDTHFCAQIMQTSSMTTCKPFTASRLAVPRTARRATIVVATAQDAPPTLQRRSLTALLAALPVALPASRALALIPDDDDEELVERARANRKNRLASERQAEKAFTRSEGFVSKTEQKDLVPVQRAVNSLALAGQQLAAGEVNAASATLSDGWTGDFKAAAQQLSFDGTAQASVSKLLSDLSALQDATKGGSLGDAKAKYVALVGSLQGWVSDAGIAGAIKGL